MPGWLWSLEEDVLLEDPEDASQKKGGGHNGSDNSRDNYSDIPLLFLSRWGR